jgi:hypothetical protein
MILHRCILVFAMLCCSFDDVAGQTGRQIAVTVTGRPTKATFEAGQPILVDIEIRNDLRGPIRYSTFALEPNEWNGETTGIELVEIRRLPDRVSVWRGRPEARPPMQIAGMTSHPIAARSRAIRLIDVSKWTVTGGWSPGRYELQVRVDMIDLDEHMRASVTSDPFEIVIGAAGRGSNTRQSDND